MSGSQWLYYAYTHIHAYTIQGVALVHIPGQCDNLELARLLATVTK